MRTTLLTGSVSLTAVLFWGIAQADTLQLTTEEYPPFNFKKNGEIVGHSTEIVQQAMDKAAVKYRIDLMSWTDAYNKALNENMTCVFTTTHTAQRDALFQWVEPLAVSRIGIAALKDKKIMIKNVEDLKNYKVGTYQDDAGEQILKGAGIPVLSVKDDADNLKRIKDGSIDLWVVNQAVFEKEWEDDGLQYIYTISENPMGIACNKQVPAPMIDKIQQALDGLIKDGSVEKIKAKYAD